MKKFSIIFIVLFVIMCNGCSSKKEDQDSLLKAMEIELDDIEYIMLYDETKEIEITDSKDYEFLNQYIFTKDYDGELSELHLFPKTKRGSVVIKDEEELIYILETGSIVYDYKEYSSEKQSLKKIFDR